MATMICSVAKGFPLPPDVKAGLEEAGIAVVEYDPNPVFEIEITIE